MQPTVRSTTQENHKVLHTQYRTACAIHMNHSTERYSTAHYSTVQYLATTSCNGQLAKHSRQTPMHSVYITTQNSTIQYNNAAQHNAHWQHRRIQHHTQCNAAQRITAR